MDYAVILLIPEKAEADSRLENLMFVDYEGKPFKYEKQFNKSS